MIPNLGDPRTATACACQAGLVTIGTEMAGGGSVSREALALCRTGVRNVLVHLGVLPDKYATPVSGDDRVLELPGGNSYVYATMDGIFESFHALGTEVKKGEPAGRIHCTWDATRQPETLHYGADGVLYGRRQPGRVRPGNCCLTVAQPYQGAGAVIGIADIEAARARIAPYVRHTPVTRARPAARRRSRPTRG